MMQITANHIKDLVHKEKMQDERFVRQDQISGNLSHNKSELAYDIKKPKNKLFKNIVASKMKGK